MAKIYRATLRSLSRNIEDHMTENLSAGEDRKPFEEWAKLAKTPKWLVNGAKCGNRWPVGKEMTKTQYDAAIAAVEGVTHK